jgi:hypothetical protein
MYPADWIVGTVLLVGLAMIVATAFLIGLAMTLEEVLRKPAPLKQARKRK